MAEELRLPLANLELAARAFGPVDGRPVLALHGWLDNAASFERLAPHLPALRVVAPDLPGHGLSDHRPPGGAYALWDYCLELLQLADALGWKRFSVIGHSMGASIGLLLAAALGERVDRLVLLDGLLSQTTEPEEAPERLASSLRRFCRSSWRTPLYAAPEEAVVARMQSQFPVSREAAQWLVERGLKAVEGGYAWRSDPRLLLPSPVRLSAAQARGFVEAIRCPVRLILGEQGLYAGCETLDALCGPTFERFLLPGGHHLHLDEETGARAVAALVGDWLAL